MAPSFQQTGTWYEYFTGDSLQVTDINASVSLESGEYKLYTDKKLQAPEFIVGIVNQKWDQNGFDVSVYPNPSREDFNIVLFNSRPFPITISVEDITGREIRRLASNTLVNGTYLFQWNGKTETGDETSSGMYLIQISTPIGQQVIKIIK